MIKNNIVFFAAISNALVVLVVTFLLRNTQDLSLYLEFLLVLQLISFFDFSSIAFAQKFAARVSAGACQFENYGSDYTLQLRDSICKELCIKFLITVMIIWFASIVACSSFLWFSNRVGFFTILTDAKLLIISIIGFGTQLFLLLINLLIGFERILFAKSLEIVLSMSRISAVLSLVLVYRNIELASILYIYLYSTMFAIIVAIAKSYKLFHGLTYDKRNGVLNFRRGVYPFILRNWIQTFFGFLFFNSAALYSTRLSSSNEKVFLLFASRIFNFVRVYAQSGLIANIPNLIKLKICGNKEKLICKFNSLLYVVVARMLVGLFFSCIFLIFYTELLLLEMHKFLLVTLVIIYFHETLQSCFAQLVLTKNYVPFLLPSVFSCALVYSLATFLRVDNVITLLLLQYLVFIFWIGWYSVHLAIKDFGWNLRSMNSPR